MNKILLLLSSMMLEKSLLDAFPLPQTQRGIQRRDALLHTAYELFLHHGYDNVCLDDIVQQAGGSKASVYKYFRNKEGLLFAICDYHFAERFKLLSPPIQKQQKLHDYLYQVLWNACQALQQPNNIAFIHLILHQSKPNPALIRHLNQKWQDEILKNIQNVLTKAHQQGLLHCENLHFSALYFWGIVHDFYWSTILRKTPIITPNETEKYLRYSLDIFLKGHQYQYE